MQLAWGERSYPITGGVTLSVLFHILLALLIILGVPSFFKAEILPTPEGIQATLVSDVTAAPKVDKQGKPDNKPKQPPAPEQPKPQPPKPTTQVMPTPSAPPPPQAAPQKAVAIPDETKKPQPDQPKKPDTPKPDDKKPAKKPDDKPKKDTQQAQMDALLKNLTTQPPAPQSQDKPKPNAQAAPAEPTVGQQTTLINDTPMTASQEDAIRAAVENHWSTPIGMANIESYTVVVRLYMNPDGTVQHMELIDPMTGDQGYQVLAESAQRAVELTVQDLGRLPIPQDKSYPTIVLRWPMKDVCQDMGGC